MLYKVCVDKIYITRYFTRELSCKEVIFQPLLSDYSTPN